MKTSLFFKAVAHALCKRWLLWTFFFLSFSTIGSSQQTLTTIAGWNAYVHLPDDYATTGSQTYPAIIFMPGTGQVGTNAANLLVYGPSYFIANGWNGYVTTTTGATVKPIIISIQPPALWPSVSAVDAEIQAIKSLYRVDPKRINLTGLSMGGWASEMYVMSNPTTIASVVAMTAVTPTDNPAYPTPFATYAQDCGHWLGYEQINDFRDMQTIANTMNAAVAGSAVYFQTNVGGGGHCCWNTWYDPAHTDNYSINGTTGNWNIYTFMVSYSGCTAGTPPTVTTGSQQTVTLPTSTSSLSGTAAGNGGATISNTAWTQVSGPVTATITTAGSLNTTLTGLTTAGTYVFKLTATDNSSMTNTATQTVVVNAAPAPVPPTVTAGSQQTITLPTSTSSLSGTATGNGGATISSTAWTQTSGPVTATITTAGSLTTTVTGLTTAGTYVFQLTATDNNTLTASATQNVVVNAAAPNVPPTVTAGSQQTITLPTSTSSLSGTATGNGGATISSTAWTQTSGPVTATITTAGSLNTTVTGLTTAGTYVFKLTATDNNTLTGSATQNIVVNAAAPNVPPTVTAGSQQTITLPTSTSSLSGTATGNGGATISNTAWTQTSGPVTATITTAGSLNTTVTGLTAAGTYVFQLTATDNNTLTGSATQNVVVNAAAPNVPPTVTAGSQQTITLPTSTSSLSGTATGNGGATISSTAWTQTSGPVTATITTAGSLNTTVTGLTAAGTYVFQLTATDNNTLTASATQNVVVNAAPNVPPTVTAGSTQTITLPTSTATLSGTATGNGGATISSTVWTEVSGGAAVITTAGSLTTTVTGLTQGTYVFQLTATDNNTLTASATQTVVVNAPAPVPPTVTAGSQQTITLPTSTANLSGTAAGNNGATISSTAWTQVSGPATATITSSGNLSTTVTGLVAGAYVFKLTATDNNTLTASATQTVVVNPAPNVPPSVDAGSPQAITLPTSTASLSGTATGNNGATISTTAWTQVSGPSTATITSSGSLNTTITGLIAGSYTFKLTATDNNTLSASSNVTITVNPAPTAPTVSAGNNVSITLPTNSVTLTGTASGTNGATISTTRWSETSGGAATITSPGNLSTTITGLAQGTYIFTLTVTDNNGLTNTSSVTVTVYGVGNACGCDFILTPPATDGQVYLDGTVLGVKPGNKVCLASAHYVSVFLFNFMGAPGNPITIVNCGGPVTISGYASYGFILSHSSYVHISGAGDPATKYGIQIDGGPASTSYGYSENGHVRDIEVDHLEVKNIAGVGMGCAPTPSCDPTTWSTSWKMYNISFHDNYVHDTQGEGYYIGNTQYDYTYTCSGTDVDVHPQQIDSVKFYNNIIDKAGWTAAQISQVTGGVDIHDNLITNYGYLNKPQHQAGIIVGEFSHGSVYRNKILNGTGDAFQYFGSGTTLVYNNIFANAGYDGSAQGQPAVFVDDRALPAGYPHLQLFFLNNTIVAPARNAISFYNDYGTVQNGNLIANNIITAPGILSTIPAVAYFDLQANPHATTSNNLTVATSDIPKFLNLAGNDYHLLLGSPAIDAGMDVSSYGVTSDMEGNSRPYGTAYDVGAYEYTGAPPPLIANAGGNQVIALPQTTATLDGSKSVDPAGTILTYTWTQLSGPNTAAIGAATAVSSPLSGLVQGTYQFKLVITDTRGLTAADSMTLVVNAPLPNQPPVADAGANQAITLPVNSVTLNGGASTDVSGTITTYTWILLSGPNTPTIVNSASVSTAVNNLVQGTYQFKLVVTDNNGLSASSVVTIQVNAAVVPPPPPVGPVANAGVDQTLTLPGTITLDGSSSTDAGGTITTYAWTQVSGPNTATVANPGAVSSSVSNLQAGTYQFKLTVTDNNGSSASDVMTVVVNAAAPPPPANNQPPVAVPGPDQHIPAPAIVSLDGSASYDPDGTIAQYRWAVVAGAGGVTIVNSGAARATVYGLNTGTYTFQLTVTDNSGVSASATMTVYVGTGAAVNALVAVAGSDTILSLPASQATLNGSVSYDVGGSIVSYYWRQIGGTAGASIAQPNAAVTDVSQLGLGVYSFELTVTDNNNLTARDTVKVTVVDNGRHNDLINIYPNPAVDYVTINALNDYLGKAKVNIFDIGGQIVKSMEFEKQSTSFNQTISVNRLARGTYIIMIQFAGAPKPEVIRMIKQ